MMRARLKRVGAAPGRGIPAGEVAVRGLKAVPLPQVLQESAAELWAALQLASAPSAEKLQELARVALNFSPRVSLEAPDAVLLEVRGSLHLFGGVAALRQRLLSACAQLELRAVLALAPLPRAALVAARAGRSLVIGTRAELIGQLAPLPLAALRWPPEVIERLKRMGVRSVGEVLRLPRAGFARRFGVAQLACLDVLSGRTPEVRRAFRARERFRRRRELNHELQDHERLLHALGPLLEELEAFLRDRQLGITQLECRFLHRAAAPSGCVVKLAAPAAAAAHLAALLKEQLARVQLPEPVRSLELRADALLAYVPQAQALWQPGEHGGGGGREAHGLIERLRARLGEEAVYGLTLLEGHRPERTWALTAPPPVAATPPPAVAAAGAPRRPLWLLLEPQPLRERAGLPRRRGALRLLSEPERIESGWWDGADIARDYYTALDTHGVRLWVFRERRAPHGWFLHGIFG